MTGWCAKSDMGGPTAPALAGARRECGGSVPLGRLQSPDRRAHVGISPPIGLDGKRAE
jgi:hypothetical protein